MTRPFGTVALGGTFDRLHVGHEALLGAAFAGGRSVVIGLTTEAYLADHPKSSARSVQRFGVRAKTLRAFLRTTYPRRRWRVVPLKDRFGRAIEPGVDALAISAETRDGARAVNRERTRRGLATLPLIEVPLVLADDLLPVSSTRVRAGVITPRGRRRAPVKIQVTAADRAELSAAILGVRSVFPRAVVRGIVRAVPAGSQRPSLAVRWAELGTRAYELSVGAVPDRRGGWQVAVARREFSLRPRHLAPGSSGALTRGVRSALRPSETHLTG